MNHLTDKEVSDLFHFAYSESESGNAEDGYGNSYSAQQLFHENEIRYAQQWALDFRNGTLTEDQMDFPPKLNQTWDDFAN